MTARLLLSNLLAFALQTTVLVVAGAALARIFRLDAPKALLVYWRTLLLVALVLPFCQPWQSAGLQPLLVEAVTPADAAAPPGMDATTGVQAASWPITSVVLVLLAAGAGARMLWLMIGAVALRRLRRDARLLEPLPDSVLDAQRHTGAGARMYVSGRVSGPITYGVRRPVVVFPPSVSTMPAHVQHAIACHELLHVKRRDWLQEIAEEAVRCALWFHPAVWWLIRRIQLAREEVVDQAVIRLTASRERYVESLLAVAAAHSRLTFTPASSFLRRRFLKKRIARILQESTMTTRRLVVSLTASATALGVAAVFAVRSFPLAAQVHEMAFQPAPVQLVTGGDQLLHGELPEYPERAFQKKVEGDVVVGMSLNDRGEVSDPRVPTGPQELRRAALEAVLHWHYSPALASTETQATLQFRLPPEGAGVDRKVRIESEAQLAEHRLVEIVRAIDDPEITPAQRAELREKETATKRLLGKILVGPREQPFEIRPDDEPQRVEIAERHRAVEGLPGRLARVRTERVSAALAKEVLAHAGIAVGDTIDKAAIERLREAAATVDEHFRVEFENGPGGVVLTLLAR